MSEIKCPHCGKTFTVDESDYQKILAQVRDDEFHHQIEIYHEKWEAESKEKLNREISSLKEKQNKEINDKDLAIEKMRGELRQREMERETAVKNATSEKDVEIEKLKALIKQSETEKELAVKNAMIDKDKELSDKELRLKELEGKLDAEKERAKSDEQSIRSQYEEMLRLKDREIEHYRDFKAKMSTKMIGESLEQHCLTEFEKVRSLAFRNAYFEKDNDTSVGGTKGDFIFRDYDDQGMEYISIMFEMKNEMDEGVSAKHKNEDFLKKLDKDRNDKGCEYAVLVTMLEPDSELYNSGIVDLSHKYPKMYAIRPQFFIPLITILRNAAVKTIDARHELEVVKSQNLDVIKFEEDVRNFKDAFGRNYKLACDRFSDAITFIDKTIADLQKAKDNLLKSENQMRLADNKLEDFTIRKLTKNNPTMKDVFENAGVKIE